MGQSMPDEPIDYGNDCVTSFAADKTPKYLYVRFAKIIKCPDPGPPFFEYPPNDRPFKLTQHDTWPCYWEVTSSSWHVIIDLKFNPPNTVFWLEHLPDGRVYFYNVSATPLVEGLVLANELLDCLLGRPAHHGIGVIAWTPQATQLLEDINMERSADLFLELFPLEDGNLVYKFCRIAESTNVKILFEP